MRHQLVPWLENYQNTANSQYTRHRAIARLNPTVLNPTGLQSTTAQLPHIAVLPIHANTHKRETKSIALHPHTQTQATLMEVEETSPTSSGSCAWFASGFQPPSTCRGSDAETTAQEEGGDGEQGSRDEQVDSGTEAEEKPERETVELSWAATRTRRARTLAYMRTRGPASVHAHSASAGLHTLTWRRRPTVEANQKGEERHAHSHEPARFDLHK